jgi:hypothetical protein
MERPHTIRILYGLRISDTEFYKPREYHEDTFCKCTKNDRSRAYCSECGNKNTIMKVTLMPERNSNIEEIQVKSRTWKIHYDNHSVQQHNYYILCMLPLSCSALYYDPISVLTASEGLQDIVKKFKKDMELLGFWNEMLFGVHVVREFL